MALARAGRATSVSLQGSGRAAERLYGLGAQPRVAMVMPIHVRMVMHTPMHVLTHALTHALMYARMIPAFGLTVGSSHAYTSGSPQTALTGPRLTPAPSLRLSPVPVSFIAIPLYLLNSFSAQFFKVQVLLLLQGIGITA